MRSPARWNHTGPLGILAALALAAGGCASAPWAPRVISPNPLVIPTGDFETVWKQSVSAVDEYFDIASENRQSRTIVTQPKAGASLLEPWAGDSVGLDQRTESTLQTIRRFARVKIDPAPSGTGYSVRVEVYKELEDMVKPERQVGGSKTIFADDLPINRTREVVGPVALPLQWIPRGRDTKLEQVILDRIRNRLYY
jgi:hypothetical protein